MPATDGVYPSKNADAVLIPMLEGGAKRLAGKDMHRSPFTVLHNA